MTEELCVITCRYHNGKYGHHIPNGEEQVMAIGKYSRNKGVITIEAYTSHSSERCINCPYAKVYLKENGRWKEKNGSGLPEIKLRFSREARQLGYDEIEGKAIELGFPY